MRMGAVVPAEGHTAGIWTSPTQGPQLKVTHSWEMGEQHRRGPERGHRSGQWEGQTRGTRDSLAVDTVTRFYLDSAPSCETHLLSPGSSHKTSLDLVLLI